LPLIVICASAARAHFASLQRPLQLPSVFQLQRACPQPYRRRPPPSPTRTRTRMRMPAVAVARKPLLQAPPDDGWDRSTFRCHRQRIRRRRVIKHWGSHRRSASSGWICVRACARRSRARRGAGLLVMSGAPPHEGIVVCSGHGPVGHDWCTAREPAVKRFVAHVALDLTACELCARTSNPLYRRSSSETHEFGGRRSSLASQAGHVSACVRCTE